MEEKYLVHHGINGQKWGIRRFQNEDGSLTDAGRARYSKAAEKEYKKAYKELYNKNTYIRRQVEAHNITADEYNNGKIAEYNRTHDPKDKNYMDEYNKQFDNDMAKNFTKLQVQAVVNNVKAQNGTKLVEQYGLQTASKFIEQNYNQMKLAEKYLSNKITYDELYDELNKLNERLKE